MIIAIIKQNSPTLNNEILSKDFYTQPHLVLEDNNDFVVVIHKKNNVKVSYAFKKDFIDRSI